MVGELKVESDSGRCRGSLMPFLNSISFSSAKVNKKRYSFILILYIEMSIIPGSDLRIMSINSFVDINVHIPIKNK